MPEIRFSVVINCYCQAEYIRATVDSVLNQSCPPFEVIVVDDASKDDTVAILRSYGQSIQLVANAQNQGISRSRNAGAARATGDYLVYLDGDDALKPWALALYDQIVRTCRPSVILNSLTWFEGSLPAPDDFPKSIRFVHYGRLADKDRTFRSSASAIVIERHRFEEVRGWTETIALMQDHDLLAKLAAAGPAIHILSPATVFYRTHASNLSKDAARLLEDGYNLAAAWRARPQPRGPARKLVGGPLFFVVRRGYAVGLPWKATRLLAQNSFVIAATMLSRLRTYLFGRLPTQVLAVDFQPTGSDPPPPAARLDPTLTAT